MICQSRALAWAPGICNTRFCPPSTIYTTSEPSGARESWIWPCGWAGGSADEGASVTKEDPVLGESGSNEAATQLAFETLEEKLWMDRLGEIVRTPGGQGLSDGLRAGIGGEKKDRCTGIFRNSAHPAADGKAIDVGDLHVKNEGGRTEAVEDRTHLLEGGVAQREMPCRH